MNKLSANYDTLKQAKAENQNSYETKIKEIVGKVVKNNSGNTISLTEIEHVLKDDTIQSNTYKNVTLNFIYKISQYPDSIK